MSDEQTQGQAPGRSFGGSWEDIVEPRTEASGTRRPTRRELREAEARRTAQESSREAHQAALPVPAPIPAVGPAPTVRRQSALPGTPRASWSPVTPPRTEPDQPVQPRWSAPPTGAHALVQPPVQPQVQPQWSAPPTGVQAPVQPPVQPRWSAPPTGAHAPVQPPVQPAVPAGPAPAPAAPSGVRPPSEQIAGAFPTRLGQPGSAGAAPTAAAPQSSTGSPLALFPGDDVPPVPLLPSPSGHERQPRRRGHRVRSLLVLAVALAMVLGAGYVVVTLLRPGAGTSTVQDYAGPGGPTVQVVVHSGDTGASMAATLHDAGVVATTNAFTRAYKANPEAAKIQPGTYNLLKEMKASDAVAALLDPANKASLKVTIAEGLTAAQILQKISEKTTIPIADLQAAAANPAAIGLPDQAGGKVEGWLFPATYEIDPKATAASVLTQMTKKTTDVLTTKGIAPDQWKSVLTIASIIEREGKLPDDKPKMARVIDNRLAKGMILQVDTSTAYGLGKSAMDLTKADYTDKTNPYNLYVQPGLPPTPIASPGEASIDAVLAPADGDWLYWVTINLDTGETVFTNNITDFNNAVDQYKAWRAAHSTAATPTP